MTPRRVALRIVRNWHDEAAELVKALPRDLLHELGVTNATVQALAAYLRRREPDAHGMRTVRETHFLIGWIEGYNACRFDEGIR